MRHCIFPPVEFGEYIIGVEKIKEILPEVEKLHKEHWAETEVLYLQRLMNPDYENYVALEDNEQFILFTVRRDKKLVGDLMYYMGKCNHTRGAKLAKEDAFFISKPYRGSGLAKKYLDYAEYCLRQLGVNQIGMSDKSPCGGKHLGKLLEPMGYKPVALFYIKDLENFDEPTSAQT